MTRKRKHAIIHSEYDKIGVSGAFLILQTILYLSWRKDKLAMSANQVKTFVEQCYDVPANQLVVEHPEFLEWVNANLKARKYDTLSTTERTVASRLFYFIMGYFKTSEQGMYVILHEDDDRDENKIIISALKKLSGVGCFSLEKVRGADEYLIKNWENKLGQFKNGHVQESMWVEISNAWDVVDFFDIRVYNLRSTQFKDRYKKRSTKIKDSVMNDLIEQTHVKREEREKRIIEELLQKKREREERERKEKEQEEYFEECIEMLHAKKVNRTVWKKKKKKVYLWDAEGDFKEFCENELKIPSRERKRIRDIAEYFGKSPSTIKHRMDVEKIKWPIQNNHNYRTGGNNKKYESQENKNDAICVF